MSKNNNNNNAIADLTRPELVDLTNDFLNQEEVDLLTELNTLHNTYIRYSRPMPDLNHFSLNYLRSSYIIRRFQHCPIMGWNCPYSGCQGTGCFAVWQREEREMEEAAANVEIAAFEVLDKKLRMLALYRFSSVQTKKVKNTVDHTPIFRHIIKFLY